MNSVDIAVEAIYYAMELEAPKSSTERIFGDGMESSEMCCRNWDPQGWGAVGGAGVGTVTLPVIGTVSGTALGGWSGALVGVATFC